VKLRHVLDAITKVTDKPLQYAIEDYAVVITQRAPGPPQLFTRTFRVDPSTFLKMMCQAMGDFVGGVVVPTNHNETVQSFFRLAGVDLPTTTGQGGGFPGSSSPSVTLPSQDLANARKAVFFNDRTGVLFVRATLEDIDIIEQALQVLNHAPPQIQIDVKWVELSDADSRALGFDWFLGHRLPGLTAPSSARSPISVAVDYKVQKGDTLFKIIAAYDEEFARQGRGRISQEQVKDLNPDLDSDRIQEGQVIRIPVPALIQGSENLEPRTNAAVTTVTGILTEAQFATVLRALKQRGGVDILAAPKVTTLSGRKAKIEVTQPKTVVNELAKSTGKPDDPKAGVYRTEAVSVGPSVEITPHVLADGRSIQIEIDARMVEFLGYDDPGPPNAASDRQPATAVAPLPRFRVRKATGTASFWDGQTVVMSGFVARETRHPQREVPVLGDIPLLGRLFRSELQSRTNKNLILFVTPTIIDPAGNRVHPMDKPTN